MIAKLANRIAGHWEERNLMSHEEKEIYVYGLDIIIASLFITFLIVCISLVFGNILYAIFYYMCTMPLRGYCGGFHAKTHWGCSLTQCMTFISVVSISLFWDGNNSYIIIFVVFTLLVTLVGIFAPVEHPGNPIDTDKKKTLKIRGLVTISVIHVLIVVLMLLQMKTYATIMLLSTVTSISSMLFALPGSKSKEDLKAHMRN